MNKIDPDLLRLTLYNVVQDRTPPCGQVAFRHEQWILSDYRDKEAIDTGTNMKITIDILCVQEPKIPSNSFFRYKDFICATSTDIQGGEEKQSKTISRKTIKISPDINPPRDIMKNQKPKAEHEATLDNPTYPKTIKKSKNRADVIEYLSYMETRIRQKTFADRTLTLDDVTDAFMKCT